MIIEIKATDVVYLTTSTGKTVYIDDTTDELIIDAWDNIGQPIEPMIMFVPDFEIPDLEIKDKPKLTIVKKEKDDDE